MKNFKIIFLFLFAASLLNGCKKEEYPVAPPPPTPEFTFTGTVGGNGVSLQAGMNDYYMFTSYALDGNGVYDFTGEFRDKNCSSNCPNALKISIKDYRKYASNVTSVDTSIVPAYYSFATPLGTPSSYYVMFADTTVNGIPQTFTWDFGDGSKANNHKPVHVYNHPGVYTVSLTTQTNACSSVISNNIVVGRPGNAFQPELYEAYSSGNTVHFGGSPGGFGMGTFVLDFGDGNRTTGTNWNNTYPAPGVYPAKLTVTDSTGYTAVWHVNAGTQTTTSCYNNFRTTSAMPAPNILNLSTVTIEWHDAGGILYTSSNNNQSPKSTFKIFSVDDYQVNINGQRTKKIHANISCTLYNGTNSTVLTGDVVFSVAYL